MSGDVTVVFQPEGKRVTVKPGGNLLEIAKLVGVDITSVCGGRGTCGKCKVVIEENRGNVSPLTAKEGKILSPSEVAKGYRLACCTFVGGQVVVKVPEESRTGRQRLQVEGVETPVALNPPVCKYFLKLPKPSLSDPKPDAEILLGELRRQGVGRDVEIDFHVLQTLPVALRKKDWSVTVVMWNGRVIGVEPGDTTRRAFGYAVDIGTTKLAGYLLDLLTGKVVAVESMMNPQISYGEDVIARITYASKGLREQRRLQKVVISAINKMLDSLLNKTGVKRGEVYEMVAVGNTAMHHLALGICPKYLALSPYTPANRRGVNVAARNLGVRINPNGNVYFLPIIGGFVGADTMGVLLATGMYKRDEMCLAIDIGTNTEVLLGNKDEILACSCASGPAFEGAHIKHGMRAATGAIEKIKIDEKFEVKYETIDGEKPRGICGSAMIDFLAEALKAGLIDFTGVFNREISSDRLRSGERGLEFVVAWGEETFTGEDIVITQNDIKEILLAKAAIHTGISILMKKKGLTERDIDVFFVAGAFGSYINPENARIIGMYPELPLERVRVVGNAAGTGARMALCSRDVRETAETLVGKVKYVELAAEAGFQAEFLNSYFLPHADLSRYPETSDLLRKLGRYPKRPPVCFPT
ncbi:MAG: ASKHA domain-containing protein [Candidatus Jordarchaeales archaeon]